MAFVLRLSTTTSTTIKVGMKDISTGLVEVFGMIRINLLEERNIFERKSGGATITSERNNDCECEDAYPPIMSIHSCVQNGGREKACSFPFPVRVLVLVLVLIKDSVPIKRMLTQKASVYPGFNLMSVVGI